MSISVTSHRSARGRAEGVDLFAADNPGLRFGQRVVNLSHHRRALRREVGLAGQ